MLLLVAAAFWIPCQIAWLNDLSLMPPVSVTMHALNVPLPAAAAGLDVDVVGVELLVELEDDPQAAASSATAARPAAIRIFALKLTSSGPGAPRTPGNDRLDRWPPGRLGQGIGADPPWVARRLVRVQARAEARGGLLAALLRNRDRFASLATRIPRSQLRNRDRLLWSRLPAAWSMIWVAEAPDGEWRAGR